MKEYDVSIIVPIYNGERYIKSCVNTILNQEYYDLSRIQMILVDDGSTDNSLMICNKLKQEVDKFTIDVITGKNGGVSSARNKGIRSAKGKYIMFLDSDDMLSKKAIAKLVKFFEKHYDEIDLITYPLYNYKNSKDKKILPRYKDFGETKIYDLEKDFWAVQPTMNVMIKNLYENNILFDERVLFHEDLLYNTQIVTKKLKMGYVKEARYYYRLHQESTTENKENPLYSFEHFMYVAEYLFNNYCDENGNVPKYIQRIILNVIRYRINKDKLFPYHLQGKEWDVAYKRIINIINKIDNETIMNYGLMDKYHKMYLISLKGEETKIYYDFRGNYSINQNNNILIMENNVEIVVNRLKIKKGKVYILGILKSPLIRYKEPQMSIIITKNNEQQVEQKIELTNTVANRYKAEIETAKFYKYECEIDVKETKQFNFLVQFGEFIPNIKFYFNTWSPFNGKLKSYKIYSDDGYRVQFMKNTFLISKPKKKTVKKDFKRSVERYKKIDKNINVYRYLAKISNRKNNKIWLYYDRNNVFDNGYYQFKHDVKIKDNIKKYYIIDGKEEIYKNKFTKKELKNVVKFGSFKHKMLFLNSDKILTSFSSLQEYCPFYTNYQYYKDILKYELIYLQHGILHAKLLKMYAKIYRQIDKFVISSEFERNNLIENYDYSPKDLIETGMPRLDEKIPDTIPENKIIFAPSWRKYLIGETINRRRKVNKKKFMNSKYFIETINFLKNETLIEKLKENDIILDFKLHPIFESYKDCFNEIVNDNVVVSIGNTDLNKYKAFITDFSSFQFDFVNIGRPIIYFMPDMVEFNAGLHSYRELDLKYENAFGNLCLTGLELVEELIKLINNDFKMEEIYKQRMDNFFFKVDNRKDKLYEILKQD